MAGTVLITGASGGIGLDLAEIFAKDRYDLVLVARNKVRLKQAADDLTSRYGVGVNVYSFDLAKPESPAELYHVIKKKAIRVDILVNNAGFGNNGFFLDNDLKSEIELIQLNISCLVQLTHLFSKDMVANKKGKILNIASTAAFQPGPFMANYCASKAYVLSFSEAIHEELKDRGVVVTTLCPGPTRTAFFKRANMDNIALIKDSSMIMDSKKVAKIGYDALMKGKPVVVAGFMNRLLVKIIKFSPGFLVRRIAKSLLTE